MYGRKRARSAKLYSIVELYSYVSLAGSMQVWRAAALLAKSILAISICNLFSTCLIILVSTCVSSSQARLIT